MCATKQATKTVSEPVLTWKEGVSISVDLHTLDWRQVISDTSGCHDPKLARLTHTCKINTNWEQLLHRITYLRHQNVTKNVLQQCKSTNPKLIHTLNAQKPDKLINWTLQLREAFTCLCKPTHTHTNTYRESLWIQLITQRKTFIWSVISADCFSVYISNIKALSVRDSNTHPDSLPLAHTGVFPGSHGSVTNNGGGLWGVNNQQQEDRDGEGEEEEKRGEQIKND